jgi:hypothetical protein
MRALILLHEKDFPFNRKTTKNMNMKALLRNKQSGHDRHYDRRDDSKRDDSKRNDSSKEYSKQQPKEFNKKPAIKKEDESTSSTKVNKEELSSMTKPQLAELAKEKTIEIKSS